MFSLKKSVTAPLVAFFVTCLLTSGCGSSDAHSADDVAPGSRSGIDGDTTQRTSSEEYSYSFTYNGCPTGKQTFPSQQAMCDGLRDENLNQSCARQLRKQYFESNGCLGSF